MAHCLINAAGICKKYRFDTQPISVLNNVDFMVKEGEFVSVTGPSGSGKSTLLHILGCLDHPTAGTYHFNGSDVLDISDHALSRLRAEQIGFVFQTFNLVSTLTVYENVELPFLYSSRHSFQSHHRISKAIEQVGLGKRINHKPAELSGGEMQRVAIARAVAIDPKLILADEPTGNLDTGTGAEILALFRNLHQQGATIVMVTHDKSVADQAQRSIQMIDGQIVSV